MSHACVHMCKSLCYSSSTFSMMKCCYLPFYCFFYYCLSTILKARLFLSKQLTIPQIFCKHHSKLYNNKNPILAPYDTQYYSVCTTYTLWCSILNTYNISTCLIIYCSLGLIFFRNIVRVKYMRTQRNVEEKGQQKCKRPETGHVSPLCRFCKMELKQGPNSPHIHTGFPGVAGKYVHCLAKVFSIYQPQGMQKDDLERL